MKKSFKLIIIAACMTQLSGCAVMAGYAMAGAASAALGLVGSGVDSIVSGITGASSESTPGVRTSDSPFGSEPNDQYEVVLRKKTMPVTESVTPIPSK